jgi:hypothetical protein
MRDYPAATDRWSELGHPPPNALSAARLELHYAAQPLAAAARSHLPAEPDDSHTSLTWSDDRGGRLVLCLPGEVRASLSFRDLSIETERGDGSALATLPLAGRTLGETLDALRRALASAVADRPLELPTYDLPPHPMSDGAAFEGVAPEARVELARWFANAAPLLEVLSRRTLGASPVRVWPHHFDIATLVTLDPPGGDPETARSINVGLSPGDPGDPSPYLYCNPWKIDPPADPPELEGGGTWHRDGWFGATLKAEALVSGRQPERAVAFLASAMAANRRLLEAF